MATRRSARMHFPANSANPISLSLFANVKPQAIALVQIRPLLTAIYTFSLFMSESNTTQISITSSNVTVNCYLANILCGTLNVTRKKFKEF